MGHVCISLVSAYVGPAGCLKVLLSALAGCHSDEELVFLQHMQQIVLIFVHYYSVSTVPRGHLLVRGLSSDSVKPCEVKLNFSYLQCVGFTGT